VIRAALTLRASVSGGHKLSRKYQHPVNPDGGAGDLLPAVVQR
jgi:hypothetical protein